MKQLMFVHAPKLFSDQNFETCNTLQSTNLIKSFLCNKFEPRSSFLLFCSGACSSYLNTIFFRGFLTVLKITMKKKIQGQSPNSFKKVRKNIYNNTAMRIRIENNSLWLFGDENLGDKAKVMAKRKYAICMFEQK